jgi:Lipocalin-like domain
MRCAAAERALSFLLEIPMAANEDVLQRMVGTWYLVQWEAHNPDGTISYPLGKDVAGQIMYGDDGQMSVQLMRTDQPRFANDDWGQATPVEKAEAWTGYFGYFGTSPARRQLVPKSGGHRAEALLPI